MEDGSGDPPTDQSAADAADQGGKKTSLDPAREQGSGDTPGDKS